MYLKKFFHFTVSFIALIICANEILAQDSTVNYGLVLRGEAQDISCKNRMPEGEDVICLVNLKLTLINEGTETLILIKPWETSTYESGRSSLAYTREDGENKSFFHVTPYRGSATINKRLYKSLAEKLDVNTPPSKLTYKLKLKESVSWKDTAYIQFSKNIYPNVWNEISLKDAIELDPNLWLCVYLSMYPVSVELLFKPNLAIKLKKRWRKYGVLFITDSDENKKVHYAELVSEPIKINWGKAKSQIKAIARIE